MPAIRNQKQSDLFDLVFQRIPRRTGPSERLVLETGWLRNFMYFGGKQHFAIIGNTVTEVPAGEHEIRYKANFVQPLTMRAVAKLLNVRGEFEATPVSGSTYHRDCARLSDRVLDERRIETDYEQEKLLAYLIAATAGTSFYKCTWNPEDGDPKRFYWFSDSDHSILPPEAMTNDDRLFRDRNNQFDDYPSGAQNIEAVSPFQMHPDPVSKGKIKDCRWIAQVQYLPKDYVAEKYGIDEDDIEDEEHSPAMDRWEDSIALMAHGIAGPMFSNDQQMRERRRRVWLCQMWERPSRKHKKGRYCAVIPNLVLVDRDNPYAGDARGWLHLPFVKNDWLPMPLRFWGNGLVEQLTGIQFRYNQARAKKAEFEDVHGNASIFVPKGSGIPKDSIVKKPGVVWEYNSAYGKPDIGPVPQLPKEVSENASEALAEMKFLASQSEIDAGKFPGEMRSGAALRSIIAERDLVLGVTARNSLRSDRDVGRMILKLEQMFGSEQGLVKIRGSNGLYSIKTFRAADLSTDIRLIGRANPMETQDVEEARLLDFVQQGALQPATNPEHAQMMVKALKNKTAEEIVQDFTMHEEQQEEEIRRMRMNPTKYAEQPYPIMPYEDHAAHKRVMERLFTNLDEWDQIDPFTQSVLMRHWALHDSALQQIQQQMMAQLEAAKGTPGAQGQPSAPSR